ADGYQASPDQRWRLPDACLHQMTKHADDVEVMAGTDPAFARLVELGVPRNARRDAEWVSDNEAVLTAAVCQRRSRLADAVPDLMGQACQWGCRRAQRMMFVAAPPRGRMIVRSANGRWGRA